MTRSAKKYGQRKSGKKKRPIKNADQRGEGAGRERAWKGNRKSAALKRRGLEEEGLGKGGAWKRRSLEEKGFGKGGGVGKGEAWKGRGLEEKGG